MVEDAAVITDQPSTESVTQGKMRNENNCMPARSINMYDDFTVNSYILFYMVEDDAVTNQGPSSANEGKMHNDNCMPAWSINIYDDFTVNSYFIW